MSFELSNNSNLLERDSYKYSLQNVKEPNLYRDYYSYDEVPKVVFNHRHVPIDMPKDIWITDTSLRDGQQSVEPYSVDQIVQLYKFMSRLASKSSNGFGSASDVANTPRFIYRF